MLVGNYHEYIKAKRDGRPLPTPRGLRTIIEANNMKNMALVSYRTIIAFRVGFEIELVRAIAKKQGDSDVTDKGKTVLSTFESYLVAFGDDAKQTLIRESGYTYDKVAEVTKNAINLIVNGGESGFVDSLTPMVKETASKIYSESTNWLIADKYIVK